MQNAVQLDPVNDYKRKYGFFDAEKYVFKAKRGLSEEIVREISFMKSEPDWMLQRRLKALNIFRKKPMPNWGADLSVIDFENIFYYLKATDKQSKTWEDLPAEIKSTYDKLGIPEAERNFLAGVSAQYECLAKGVQVWTEKGVKSIESITIADKVWAYDEEKRRVGLHRVLGIQAKGIQDVYRVETTSRSLECTKNHPFLYTNRTREGKLDWRYLSDLKVGDYVVTARKHPEEMVLRPTSSSGLPSELGTEKIRSVEWNGLSQTYDIEVDGAHNFIANGLVVHNSEVVYHSLAKKLEEQGVIFCDTDTALREHEDLLKEYFGTIIPSADNKFAALNTAVWSGGSFIYIPKGVRMEIPLQAYFRINAENMGQFERTLIICDEGSFGHYIEGCHLGTAMTRVPEGEKPISQMSAGDLVLTHQGRWRPVLATQKRKHRGDLFTINFESEGYRNLHVTPGHPFLVRRSNIAGEANQVWLEAHQLRVGDQLALPAIREAHEKARRDVLESQVPIGREKTLERVGVGLDAETCWLIGLFLAEGTVSANTSYLIFDSHTNEQAIRDQVTGYMRQRFAIEPWVYAYPDRDGVSLRYSSIRAARLFASQLGRILEQRHIPDWIFSRSIEERAALLRGFYAGEGSWDAGQDLYRVNQTNQGLGQRCRELLLTLGIRSSLSRSVRQAPRRDIWQLAICKEDNRRFEEIVLKETPRTRTHEGAYTTIQDGMLWMPIRSITSLWTETDVYNLKVAEDESYVCEGVVSHNCTAPIYTTDSLHSAVVEIIVKKNARFRYTTIQNWSTNVFNLVTKRAVVYQDATMEWVDGNLGCLVAGTPVETARGIKPIEKVDVGEEVYSLNAEFEVMKAKVSATKRNPPSATWRLVTADEHEVTATANHPFLVLQQSEHGKRLGWQPLEAIKAGDQVACVRRKEDMREVYFSKVEGVANSDWRETYDLEVDGGHNFVADGVVVHNSQITMKYPSCYLMESGAKGDVLSVAFAGKGQHQDAGGKMVHVAPNTTGTITSKSISKDGGRTSYRGHVKIYPGANNCKSFVKCDALLLDEGSRSDTYPYIDVEAENVTLGHEASVSKVSDEQLFYLMSRGITRAEAEIMIINGFIEPFTKELPLEYAVELNRLIQLEMTGSVG